MVQAITGYLEHAHRRMLDAADGLFCVCPKNNPDKLLSVQTRKPVITSRLEIEIDSKSGKTIVFPRKMSVLGPFGEAVFGN